MDYENPPIVFIFPFALLNALFLSAFYGHFKCCFPVLYGFRITVHGMKVSKSTTSSLTQELFQPFQWNLWYLAPSGQKKQVA